MAYANALQSIISGNEHNGLAPLQYSESNYVPAFTTGYYRFNLIGYCQSKINPYKYDNYAGTFRTKLVRPTIVPDVGSNYTGIAPYDLMPTLNLPYPYESSFNRY